MTSKKKKSQRVGRKVTSKRLDVDISWYSAVKISKIDMCLFFVPEVERSFLS